MKAREQKRLSNEIQNIIQNYGATELQINLKSELESRLESLLIGCGIFLADIKKVNYLMSACEKWSRQRKPNIDLREIVEFKDLRTDLEQIIELITPKDFTRMLATVIKQNDLKSLRTALKSVLLSLSDKEIQYTVKQCHRAAIRHSAVEAHNGVKQPKIKISFPRVKSAKNREILSCLAQVNDPAVMHAEALEIRNNIIREKIGTQMTEITERSQYGHVETMGAIIREMVLASKERGGRS